MRIRTETSQHTQADVELAGRFDAHEVPEFRASVDGLIAGGHTDLWIDLGNVVFIDSTALAELVRLSREVGETGRLRLGPVSDPVRVILELTALLPVFEVEDGSRPHAGAGGS